MDAPMHSNSSNKSGLVMETGSRRRHTAQDFVDAGLQICERDGSTAVTARRVAKEMGLSAMALYRHFRGIRHLQAMVWNEICRRLIEAMSDAEAQGKCRVAGFHAAGLAYVHFGIGHQGLYQCMFSDGPRPEEFGVENLGLTALPILSSWIARLHDAGDTAPELDVHRASLHIWFVLHGLTTLVISKQVAKVTDLDLDELVRQATQNVIKCG